MSALSIPVRADLIGEMILRSNGAIDIVDVVEHLVEDFLERTKGDPLVWSEAHAEAVADEQADDTLVRIGNPSKGYNWQNVFLPNGTQLKMTYKGVDKFADVRHQQIYYEGTACSPSQFVRRVANNTSRNAWHDIWIKRPTDRDWVFSDLVRTGHVS
jgi:hypothetical protein